MDEEETKPCPNCKREIPAVNFTIHSVHCARNIKICPVCKEPVPGPELDDHHQKMHKLLPCKQCGESVCGTDLEDHIRDSCAITIKSCRYCELELPRCDIPTHEGYCGVRTEQCPDCKEYVMLKYQQLHLDSNHGFIRLDDDPAPPKKEPPKANHSKSPKSNLNKTSASSNGPKLDNTAQRSEKYLDLSPDSIKSTSDSQSSGQNVKNIPSSSNSDLPSSLTSSRQKVANSGPSSISSGSSLATVSSSDSRHSSTSGTAWPMSSSSGMISSTPDSPSSSTPYTGQGSSYSSPVLSSPDPGLSNRQGISNPRQASNPRCASANSYQDPSNARYGPANSRQALPNLRINSSNTNQSPSNSRHGSSNTNHSPSNSRHGSSNTNHSPSNSRHGSSNSNYGPANRCGPSNTRFGSPNSFQSPSNARYGPANTNLDSADSAPNSYTEPDIEIPEQNRPKNARNQKPEVKNQSSSYNGSGASSSSFNQQEPAASVARPGGVKKRTNDQPQINMDTSATKTVEKDMGVSRGAVKKRPAPQPPRSSRRDLPYYSAMQRQQREERERQEQNQYNLAHGLPPVLNPAQKLEKLRKLDVLQNRDYEEEYRSRQRRPSPEPAYQPYDQGQRLGYPDMDEATRQEFKNLKPMSPTQFMKRFSSLQVSPPPTNSGDRFTEIKSSLRELRRGLNEVTAPYNANNAAANNNYAQPRPRSPREVVQLPCEFCDMLVPAHDLVQHQTGCRPDLAQLVARGGAAGPLPPAARAPCPPCPPADPLIPCEFCARALPVYLIAEHQEQCIRENMPV